MAALILIVSFTGILLAFALTFVSPKLDVMIPIAATGLLAFVFKAISQHRKPSSNDFAEIRRMLQEEISNIRKPPSKNKLNEFAAQIGLHLDEYFGDLEIGPIIDQGMKAFMERDYKSAVKLFEENAKTQLKEAAVSWFFEGNALYFQGEYKEAITVYQKSTNFNPGLAKAWYNWGVALEVLGLHEKAKEKYEKAQGLDTSVAEIEYNLSPAMESHVPHRESMGKCRKLLELDKGLVEYQKGYIPIKPISHPVGSMQWLILMLQ